MLDVKRKLKKERENETGGFGFCRGRGLIGAGPEVGGEGVLLAVVSVFYL